MKYLRLIIKNVGRNKRRTVLTVLSVSVSVFLLATMQAVLAAFGGNTESSGGEYRLVVRRNTTLADAMPEAYEQKIQQVSGVVAISPANWFGGIYKEDKPFYAFAQFYVDPKTIFDVHPEIQISPQEKAAFQQERTAAIAGKKLFDKYGWHLGDVIELKTPYFDLNARLILRGIYTDQRRAVFLFIALMSKRLLGDLVLLERTGCGWTRLTVRRG
jgi:putative ABC transport system permease protein